MEHYAAYAQIEQRLPYLREFLEFVGKWMHEMRRTVYACLYVRNLV